MHKVEILQKLIDNSERIVFFGGAGVSTESGIPDFRSTDGLYHQKYEDPPEIILSASYFAAKAEKFFSFYKEKMIFLDAKPNSAHEKLAELEAVGKLTAIVTQNIDGLHQTAGSKRVYELHGSVLRNRCVRCSKAYGVRHVLEAPGIPRCSCGGIVKPDVVLYEESLNNEVFHQSAAVITKADLLIIGGTSLAVYPAAGLVQHCTGKIVVINKSPTQMDTHADLLIDDPIGETFQKIQVPHQ